MSASIAALTNHQLRLAARPLGLPKAADWQFTEEPVAEPAEGGVLVKVLALSLDPAMRGWMNEGKSYIAPVGLGEVMRAGGVGVVVASKHPGFAVGDTVAGGRRAGVLAGRRRPGEALGAGGSTCAWAR
jgi:NADPH-dependent curcumin reductase